MANTVTSTVHSHAIALRKHCQEAYDSQKPLDKSKVRGIAHAILAVLEGPTVAQDSKAKSAMPLLDAGF
jgi:hypothetical protein